MSQLTPVDPWGTPPGPLQVLNIQWQVEIPPPGPTQFTIAPPTLPHTGGAVTLTATSRDFTNVTGTWWNLGQNTLGNPLAWSRTDATHISMTFGSFAPAVAGNVITIVLNDSFNGIQSTEDMRLT